MPIRSVLAAIAIALSIAVPLPARAENQQEPHDKSCVLALFKVTQIGSFYVSEHAGQGTYDRLAGARLFLAAQPGLTAEWINANLVMHMQDKKRGSSPDCPLDVAGANASVTSGGTGFWINIQAKDASAAKEILNRSRRLVQ